jgi:hypothetical protein
MKRAGNVPPSHYSAWFCCESMQNLQADLTHIINMAPHLYTRRKVLHLP